MTTNDECFAYDASLWTTPALVGTADYSTCSGTYLLGGYNVYAGSQQLDKAFTRTFDNLPSHTMIFFTISIWAIDSWNGNQDYFQVQFDSTIFNSWNNWDYHTFTTQLCGDDWSADVANVRLFGRVLHSATSLVFKMVSQFDQDSINESLGFRDIDFLFVKNSNNPTETMCAKASLPIGAPFECTCDEGQYDLSGVCTPCHSTCASCFDYGSDKCFQCAAGFGFNGDNCVQCDSTCVTCYGAGNKQCNSCQSGYLLVNNNTCVPETNCTSPLMMTGCGRYCDAPCPSGQWQLWNNTCSLTCDFPLQQAETQTSLNLLNPIHICIYPCSDEEYLYWDGTCQSDCISPLIQRFEGEKLFCDFPCAVNEVALWNTSCKSTCTFPYVQSTIKNRTICSYPCLPGEYLYPNGTCSSFPCDPYFITVQQEDKNFCNYPCPSDEFAYWNGSCTHNCSFPYIESTRNNRGICLPPCSPSQYLYSDGICLNSCDPYFINDQEGDISYCKSPCPSDKFVYHNGSCLNSCESPFLSTLVSSTHICRYPCSFNQYLYPNGSCLGQCGFKYIPRADGDKKYCDSWCPASQWINYNDSCQASCDHPMRTVSNYSGDFCLPPCSDSSYYYYPSSDTCENSCQGKAIIVDKLYQACLADPAMEAVRLLHHIKYLDVSSPRKVQKMKIMRANNILSTRVTPSMFAVSVKDIQANPLPSVFENRGIHSSFLVNFINDLVLLAILFTAEILLTLLKFATIKCRARPLATTIEYLQVITRFNLPLMLLATNVGDIIFFSIIEFRSYNPNNSGASVSLALSIIMLIAVIALLSLTSYLVYKVKKMKSRVSDGRAPLSFTAFVNKWRNFQVLFGGCDLASSLSESFFLIYTIRIALPMLAAGSLEMIPFTQSLFYLGLSITMIGYILLIKPIKSKVNVINVLLVEAALLMVNTCGFILTILDAKQNGNDISNDGNNNYNYARFSLGQAIIVGNYFIEYIAIAFLVIKVFIVMVDAYKLRKKEEYRAEKTVWLQIFFIPFQQGIYCFEEAQVDEPLRKRAREKSYTLESIPTSRNMIVTEEDLGSPSARPRFTQLGTLQNLQSGSPNKETPLTERHLFVPTQEDLPQSLDDLESQTQMKSETSKIMRLKAVPNIYTGDKSKISPASSQDATFTEKETALQKEGMSGKETPQEERHFFVPVESDLHEQTESIEHHTIINAGVVSPYRNTPIFKKESNPDANEQLIKSKEMTLTEKDSVVSRENEFVKIVTTHSLHEILSHKEIPSEQKPKSPEDDLEEVTLNEDEVTRANEKLHKQISSKHQ